MGRGESLLPSPNTSPTRLITMSTTENVDHAPAQLSPENEKDLKFGVESEERQAIEPAALEEGHLKVNRERTASIGLRPS